MAAFEISCGRVPIAGNSYPKIINFPPCASQCRDAECGR